ncbi:hypothetical protein F8M41_010349 [Gigaspora margarita]|uniref:Uncharacterized protein n=1 Tax=Gigaspora margarita TaxID=4874 RepID=A0A8H4AUE8_GIGMA|nr:hypothetical protein F8M41_010349 [Gigaspora margarita]
MVKSLLVQGGRWICFAFLGPVLVSLGHGPIFVVIPGPTLGLSLKPSLFVGSLGLEPYYWNSVKYLSLDQGWSAVLSKSFTLKKNSSSLGSFLDLKLGAGLFDNVGDTFCVLVEFKVPTSIWFTGSCLASSDLVWWHLVLTIST